MGWVSERLAVSMRQGEDIILRDYIISASSTIKAGGGYNGDNPTNYGISDFSLLAATLDNNNALKFETGMLGELRIGSGPVRSSYIMLANTMLQPDFDALAGAGFKSVWDYANNISCAPSEYGNVNNIRIHTSSEAPISVGTSTNGRNVFYNAVVGKQAVTHIDQDEFSMRMIYRDPLYSGMLAQNATLAIKFPQSQLITQDTAIRMSLCTSATNNFGV